MMTVEAMVVVGAVVHERASKSIRHTQGAVCRQTTQGSSSVILCMRTPSLMYV